MSKELEALENLKQYLTGDVRNCWHELAIIETALKDYEYRLSLAKEYKDVNNVAKRLKALEIIKEKNVDVIIIRLTPSCEAYNKAKTDISLDLDEKQYNLLKEVLL